MAASVILWSYKTNSKGESLLMIRLHKDGKRKLISTKKKIKSSDWDDQKERVKPSHPNAKWLNSFLDNELRKFNDQVLEIEKTTALPPHPK